VLPAESGVTVRTALLVVCGSWTLCSVSIGRSSWTHSGLERTPRNSGAPRDSGFAPCTQRSTSTRSGSACGPGFCHTCRREGPSEIEAWGVEIDDATTVGKDLTPAVRAAMPHVVGEICRSVQRSTSPQRGRDLRTVIAPDFGGSNTPRLHAFLDRSSRRFSSSLLSQNFQQSRLRLFATNASQEIDRLLSQHLILFGLGNILYERNRLRVPSSAMPNSAASFTARSLPEAFRRSHSACQTLWPCLH